MDKTKLSVYVLIFNMLLLSSANTMVMPFVPLYLKEELQCDGGSLALYTALAYSVTFIVSIFASPLWGKFADRFGKKPMLIRVSLILTLSYLLSFLATTPLQLCFSRALQGLASGMTPAFLGLLSVISPKNKTSTTMGFIQSANLTGTIIGPALGGALCQFSGVRECYFIIMCISFFTMVLNILIINEPKTASKTILSEHHIKELLKSRLIISLCICTLSTSMSIMMIVPMLSDYVLKLNGDANALALSGVIFSLSGAAGVIAAPFWGKVSNFINYHYVILIGLVMSAVCYLLQGFVSDLVIFAIIQFTFGFFICGIAPSVHSIISEEIAHEHQTKAYSLIYSSSQIGNLSGPVILTLILGLSSYEDVFFSIAAILLMAGCSFIFVHKKNY
ncbi:MAG: MFS transporter [Succinivibrio sp.]